MQTRRELLQQALILPLLTVTVRPKLQIISEPSCLSQESAQGFSSLLSAHENVLVRGQELIVVAGVTQMRPERVRTLRFTVEQGALLIWESAGYSVNRNTTFEEAFGVTLHDSQLARDNKYVQYRWPASAMIRSFGPLKQVKCSAAEAIAHIVNEPVAIRKQVGKGTLLFLGSMVGPHLRAEDREARELARQMLLVRS